jgi:phosphotransferase system HPr (HPr) family protein
MSWDEFVTSVDEYQDEVAVVNKYGLHARPALQLVDTANRFDCNITVANGDTEMDAKSIMSVMQLAATRGTRLRLRARGPNAKEAVAALKDLINSGFGEE